MEIDRRTLLQWALPGVSAAFLGAPVASQATLAPLFVLIDGIGTGTSPESLEFALEPLLVASIPVALVLSAADGPDGGLADRKGDLVRHLVTNFPHLLEPVLAVPGLIGLSPYFQRRAASDAMTGLRGLLVQGQGAAPMAPLTIATHGAGEANFDALRCLGIRQVIDTGPDGFVASTGCARQVVCMSGAARLDLAAEQEAGRWIARVLERPGWATLVIDVSGSAEIPVHDLRRRSESIVAAIATEVQAGRRFVVLPREQIGWFAQTQARQVALHLARPAEADQAAAAAFAEMRSALQARGIDFSIAGRPWDEAAPDDCIDLDLAEADDALRWIRGPDAPDLVCAQRREPGPLPPGLAAGIDLVLARDTWPAFGGDGALRAGELGLSGGAAALETARLRDTVIEIDVPSYSSAEARQQSLGLLEQLRGEGAVMADVPSHAAAVVAPDRLFSFLRDTYREPREETPPPGDLSQAELLADARLAWQFFERFSNPSTGLCTATAHDTDGDVYLHQELTMWDLASLLAAIMSAHELSLIPDEDFADRIGQVVAAIPSVRFGAGRLPAAIMSTRTAMALTQDFNACDTGRLLSVLREVDAHPLTRGIATEAVGRWNLDAIIAEGRVHSVNNGRLSDQSQTHCSHYTARAFRSWGHEARSPYEVAPDGGELDHRMRLLERVRAIGPFGAEPLLLEAVEMPFSAPAAFLADLLLGQQRRTFERTGQLLCVSEAPLDRAPWFMYQGLSLAAPDNPWVVRTIDGGDAWQDEAFWREVLLVNTKAAYLWAAVRPGAFSFKLARHVRDRARTEQSGFSPGVYSASGEAMKGYSDINTNGIILQAITYILRGRKPHRPVQD